MTEKSNRVYIFAETKIQSMYVAHTRVESQLSAVFVDYQAARYLHIKY